MRRRLLNVAVVGPGVMLFGVLWLWGISYRGTYQYEWWSPSYVQWICIYRGQLAWSQYRRPPSQYAWVQSRGEWYRVPPRDLSEPPGWRSIGQGRSISLGVFKRRKRAHWDAPDRVRWGSIALHKTVRRASCVLVPEGEREHWLSATGVLRIAAWLEVCPPDGNSREAHCPPRNSIPRPWPSGSLAMRWRRRFVMPFL